MTDMSFPPVTAVGPEQLRTAIGAALAAARETPYGVVSAQRVTPEALADGPYGCITSDLLADLAAVIEAAGKAAAPAAAPGDTKGLVWRGIFAFNDVVCDGRFAGFGASTGQQFHIGRALLDALATTPMTFGGDVPVDAIYRNAADAIARNRHLSERTMLYPPPAPRRVGTPVSEPVLAKAGP